MGEAFDQTINKLGKEVEEEEKVEDLENMDADRLRSMSEEYSDTLTRLLDQLEYTGQCFFEQWNSFVAHFWQRSMTNSFLAFCFCSFLAAELTGGGQWGQLDRVVIIVGAFSWWS